MIGGDGIDTVDYSRAEPASRCNVKCRPMLFPMQTVLIRERDTLINIENINGTRFDDEIEGEQHSD